MANQIQVSAKILDIWHKCTSYYGNPSKWVLFETEKGEPKRGYTATNAACGYGITNYLNKGLVNITYHYTKSGNLIIDYVSK